MRFLGYDIGFQRGTFSVTKAVPPQNLTSLPSTSAWWSLFGPIRESEVGAWQRNITLDNQQTLLSNAAIYCCVTGIATDIAKMRIKLSRNNDGIWEEVTENQPWLPVLRKPNRYQNRIQFLEQWMISKLLFGNTYALKQRKDRRGIVTGLYILHPNAVKPLVAEDGTIYYELHRDTLSQINEDPVVVPASEIIHDTFPGLWHPLIGVPPIYACSMSATMANRIQGNSTLFFQNMSRPGGMLTAPGAISNETAARLKAAFESNFGGANIGRLFVAGDGLTFKDYSVPAEQSQLIDQLKWTVEDIARAFHYPVFKLGGPLPPYAGNVDALITAYYTDCLQILIESFELGMDEGLELPPDMHVELDLDNLLRMDTAALYESNTKAVGGGWMTPDEARFRANFPSVPGGASAYLQQQNYSLEALAKRDAGPDPFGKAAPKPKEPDHPPTPPAPPPPEPPEKHFDPDDLELLYGAEIRKTIQGLRRQQP